ncbi:MAG: hypothetical protein GF399_09205 [Candidatus Coatesbacteria bacterium]|nr:hypothetical protein [Candidatus Coatesbacteria bacterium]
MVEAERPFTDKESEVTLESFMAGFLAAFGVAPDQLDAVYAYPAVGELFLVLDPPVVEALE